MNEQILNKDNVISDYMKMIVYSWTWDRMTETERNKADELLHNAKRFFRGDYKSRWNVLNAIYDAYLDGIGYSGPFWRESE